MKKFSIVTGGASGLGYEFVKLLLKDNYNVKDEAQYGGLITIPKCAIMKRWSFPRSFLQD